MAAIRNQPALPLVPALFLPTAPIPKTTEDADFNTALAPCIIEGKEETVRPLLNRLSDARRTMVSSLDPTRTTTSMDSVVNDTRKYLALVKGFRGKAKKEGEGANDPLPDASAQPSAPEAEEKGAEEGASENLAEDAPVPSLGSLASGDAAEEGKDGEGKTGGVRAVTPIPADGTLRRMMPFTWKDLGDPQGWSFRMGDTMLEEASTLFALAQVLLQKATSESLTPNTMLDVFKYLRTAAGCLEAAVTSVKEAAAPVDHMPDDLKNGLLEVLVACSMTQAQHITIRRAQMTINDNQAITHTLIAKLCRDTSERYKGMEKQVTKLMGDPKAPQKPAIARYFLAHIRYKCLYFLAMAYGMIGFQRRSENDENGCASAIRNYMFAVDLMEKAEVAAKSFVDAARTTVFVDTVTILTSIDDSKKALQSALKEAQDENNSVFYKPIPEEPDALPPAMSNIQPEAFQDAGVDPLWTSEMYTCFDPTKAPDLGIGKVPDDADCCPVS